MDVGLSPVTWEGRACTLAVLRKPELRAQEPLAGIVRDWQELAPRLGFASVNLQASWELDLFGQVRRGVEAADAEVGAAITPASAASPTPNP